MASHKDSITVVVNGTPTEVDVNDNAPLHTLIPKAIQQTDNMGQPLNKWVLKDADGNTLDTDEKIGDFRFPDGVKLFLSLTAGIGG